MKYESFDIFKVFSLNTCCILQMEAPHHSIAGVTFAIIGPTLESKSHMPFNLPLQNLCNFKLQIESLIGKTGILTFSQIITITPML